MDFVERVAELSNLGARWVLWLLLGLSIASIALVLERAYTLVVSRDDLEALSTRLRQLLDRGETTRAQQLLAESPSFEARIAAAGLGAASVASARERMAAQTELARLAMEKRLAFLGTVGNNAPFVGLLGTVIGVVRAFHALDATSGQISAGLMSAVAEALVATAIGLTVALPAVAAYNLFQSVIQARLARGDALGREVLAHLSEA